MDQARESEDLNLSYLEIFEAIPGLILVLSKDFKILNVNNDFLAATSTKKGDIIGKLLFDVFPDNPDAPEARGVENLTNSLNRVISTKIPHEMEVQRYDIPDRINQNKFLKRYWKPLNTPVLGRDGELKCILHQSIDVSENFIDKENLAESKKRESEAIIEIQNQKLLFQNFFEQAPVAITILRGTDYIIEIANPAVCEIWNRSQVEVVGKPLFDALPELKGQGVDNLLHGVFTTGSPYIGKELPVTINRSNGPEVVYFNFVYKPLLEKDEIVGITVVASDVTEQVASRSLVENKQKELLNLNQELSSLNEEYQASNEELNSTNDELIQTQSSLNQLNDELEKLVEMRTAQMNAAKKESESEKVKLQTVFMQAPVGIVIFEGSNLEITLANPSVCKMVGRSEQQLVGKPLFEAIPEIANKEFIEIYSSVYNEGKAVEIKDLPATLNKGGGQEVGYYNIFLHPIKDHSNAVTGIIEVAVEVTESVVARNTLATANQQLLRVNADLDNFIYTASHDLKAPIANIEGLTNALKRSLAVQENVKLEKFIGLIDSSIARFKKTIDILTDVVKLQKEEEI